MRHLSKNELRKIAVLQKRCDFLIDRVNNSDRVLSFDAQEANVLKWAIKFITTDGYRTCEKEWYDEDYREQTRRDERNGLYPQQIDDAN